MKHRKKGEDENTANRRDQIQWGREELMKKVVQGSANWHIATVDSETGELS